MDTPEVIVELGELAERSPSWEPLAYPEDHAAGPAPVVRPLFEEWAPRAQRMYWRCTTTMTTAEGRTWNIGDPITLEEARHIRMPVVEVGDVRLGVESK